MTREETYTEKTKNNKYLPIKVGIYIIFWPNCEYFYIGQSQNCLTRYLWHERLLRNKKHYNLFLQRVYNNYGAPIGQVVEICELTCLDKAEQYYLDICYKMRECCNGAPIANSVRGIKRSEETRNKIRLSKIGKKLTPERVEQIRESMRARVQNGFVYKRKFGKDNHFYNKHHSETSKAIMSQKKKGLYDGEKNPKARMVLNLETGIYYGCMLEAAKTMGWKNGNEMPKKIKNGWSKFMFV